MNHNTFVHEAENSIKCHKFSKALTALKIQELEAAGHTEQNPGHGRMRLFSKAMDTGIILSIAHMKKQLLCVFKIGP